MRSLQPFKATSIFVSNGWTILNEFWRQKKRRSQISDELSRPKWRFSRPKREFVSISVGFQTAKRWFRRPKLRFPAKFQTWREQSFGFAQLVNPRRRNSLTPSATPSPSRSGETSKILPDLIQSIQGWIKNRWKQAKHFSKTSKPDIAQFLVSKWFLVNLIFLNFINY